MELVVADPSASTSSSKTSHFQTLFTKQNGASRSLVFQDLCSRLLKQNDDLRSGTKFLMKQFLVESSKQGNRSNQVVRTLESLKQEHTSLKQAHNSQRMRYEKAIESLQQQLASAQKKLEEKDHQLMQFRKLHDRMTPETPRGRSSSSSEPHRVSGEGLVPRSAHQQAPPMQGFMIQKEAQERAKQQALEEPQRTQVLGGRPHSYSGGGGSDQSYAIPTPQTMERPYSTNSGGSGGIRNLSSSSGYAFSGGAVQKRRRGVSPGNMVRNNNNSNGRAMSPSQAFAMQPPGSYSVARGPSNFFQQPGGYHGGPRR
jgi:hypothetical protein